MGEINSLTGDIGAATGTSLALGGGAPITSTGAGGALGTNAFTSTGYQPLGTALLLAGGTMLGDLKFTDASFDIGKAGATRPRDIFTSRDVSVGRNLTVVGTVVTLGALPAADPHVVGQLYTTAGAVMQSAG